MAALQDRPGGARLCPERSRGALEAAAMGWSSSDGLEQHRLASKPHHKFTSRYGTCQLFKHPFQPTN